jgi:hypothetical protein
MPIAMLTSRGQGGFKSCSLHTTVGGGDPLEVVSSLTLLIGTDANNNELRKDKNLDDD